VHRALQKLRPGAPWKIVKSKIGSSGRAFVCSTIDQMVFVKFGASVGAAERLALAGVSPRLLATGVSAVGPFVIQAYVEGRVPDGRWIEEHFEPVAEIFRLVHSDAELSSFVMPLVPSTFVTSLEIRVEALRQHTPQPTEHLGRADTIRAMLGERLPSSQRTVPTHGDPNTSNFLLAEDQLFLLDWDDLRVSDRYRDVGQVLWWYVRPERWSEYAAMAGSDYDPDAETRLRWWVAAESLEVGLWLMEHDNATALDFLEDAHAALSGRGNPHAWWLEGNGADSRI
jgi:hypothetical protein